MLKMHGSWFHAPPLPPTPGHTAGDLQDFFFLGGLFPTPGHIRRAIPTPDQPHIRFIGASFWKQYWFLHKGEVFTTFINVFKSLLREGYYCHNLVKTWTINLKTEKEEKSSVFIVSLIEHFIRTLLTQSVFYLCLNIIHLMSHPEGNS